MKRKSNKNRKIIFILAALSLLISAVYAGTYFATPFLKRKTKQSRCGGCIEK